MTEKDPADTTEATEGTPAESDEAGTPEVTSGEAAESGEAGAPPKAGKSAVREWVETLAIALVFALLIRTFVVQVYMVEGPSMEPTLHTGERLLVNKLVYRFRSPAPGEIIVLQDPNTPQRELIKRVIAVGGETIEVKQGIVYVDGKPLKEPYINSVVTRRDDVAPTQVPAGFVYVMGDNRSWSFDSRNIGPVQLGNVDGKAFFMFWPADKFAYGPLDQSRTVDTAAGTTK
ncbi:MAG TPA: signal peptidase I [Symbiobacteriaceae bacterium]|jgi:signal peptidase I|nr:signal peptidase I [Symbiobacteriaceae bacterium]